MALEVNDLLARLGDDWEPNPPPAPRELERTTQAAGVAMPSDLAALYARANGGSVGPVDLFTLAEYADVNKRLKKKMPYATFFASDGADGFFFIDRDDKLAHGAGAVFWVDRGRVVAGDSVPSGVALYPFLLSVAAGVIPWEAPPLKANARARLEHVLARYADHWSPAGPPLDMGQVLGAGDRIGFGGVEALRDLWLLTDGLAAGPVTIYPASKMSAVKGTTLPGDIPGAVWIGEEAGSVQLAMTIMGWREPEGGRVVRVARGETPETAPLGPDLRDFVAQSVRAAAAGRED